MADDEKFRDLTWKHVESLGIPPSPVRDVLFALADFMDAHSDPGLFALATGAYRAVEKELAEHYRPRSPLEIQVETIRAQRELAEMLNTEFIPVEFTAKDFQPTPETPAELGASLGYHDAGRTVRRVLRRGFPDHPSNSPWSPLTDAQINYVRAHLPAR